MALKLFYKQKATVPLEVPGITPDLVAGKSNAQIGALEIFHGNRKIALAEHFEISGDLEDQSIIFEGDLSGVHWIGAKMRAGSIHVRGPAGRHVGSELSGGSILVDGDAGDWVGAEMNAGLIHVKGRAGHLIGAAYRGSARGMTGGTILIEGNVGNEIGHTMRRGLIAVGGNAGDLIGFNMLAGTIIVLGEVGIRHGAGMHRGTIGLLGNEQVELLPTFRYACRMEPTALKLILNELRQHGFAAAENVGGFPVDLYNGDLLEGGRGEVLIRAA
jgi:formylmethanofuran dehydrogenase subunit C